MKSYNLRLQCTIVSSVWATNPTQPAKHLDKRVIFHQRRMQPKAAQWHYCACAFSKPTDIIHLYYGIFLPILWLRHACRVDLIQMNGQTSNSPSTATSGQKYTLRYSILTWQRTYNIFCSNLHVLKDVYDTAAHDMAAQLSLSSLATSLKAPSTLIFLFTSTSFAEDMPLSISLCNRLSSFSTYSTPLSAILLR